MARSPKLECPSCHGQAMTFWQKACLGPAQSRACRACGARVSVSWWAVAAMLPVLPLIPASGSLYFEHQQAWSAIALLLGGFSAMFAGHMWLVPVRRS